MEQVLPNNLTVEQLRKKIVAVFKETFLLKEQLKQLVPQPLPCNKILTREEAAKLLKISLPTLNTWTKKGKLSWYRIGTRIVYSYEQVTELAMTRNLSPEEKFKNQIQLAANLFH